MHVDARRQRLGERGVHAGGGAPEEVAVVLREGGQQLAADGALGQTHVIHLLIVSHLTILADERIVLQVIVK